MVNVMEMNMTKASTTTLAVLESNDVSEKLIHEHTQYDLSIHCFSVNYEHTKYSNT